MGHILLAFLSALLLILCFPGFDFEFLAWFALVPLLIALKDRSLKSAFGLGFFTGIIFYIGVSYWLKEINSIRWIDFIILGIVLISCYFGFFGLLFNFISKKIKFPSIVAPIIWVSIEYVRSHAGFLGFPWVLLGHSQYLNLPVIQIAAFTGVYGVSFLIVMVNAAISEVILNRSKALKPILATIIVMGISFAYGLSTITKGCGGDTVGITIIQGNIPQQIKWKEKYRKQNLKTHELLTKLSANNDDNSSLIIWPEAAVQGSLKHDSHLRQIFTTLAKKTKTYLLIGSSHQPKFGAKKLKKKWLNSAFLVSPKGEIEGQYDKIYLLPFSEYMPYKDYFPWPSRFESKTSKFTHGTEYTTLSLSGAKFGVLICWENAFPELFRHFVKNGANFMVNITNEAWFGDTAAPYHFTAMSIFRAVESRISIVRSANTGISCFIDPHGKIMGRVHDHNNKDTFVEGYLTKEIPISQEKTFYTNYGDIFAYMNLIMTAFMLALSYLKTGR